MSVKVSLKARLALVLPDGQSDKRVTIKAQCFYAENRDEATRWARLLRELNPQIADALVITRTTVEAL